LRRIKDNYWRSRYRREINKRKRKGIKKDKKCRRDSRDRRDSRE
jgi:hypothetical protein